MSELVVKVQVYYVLPVLDTYILIIIGLISVCVNYCCMWH